LFNLLYRSNIKFVKLTFRQIDTSGFIRYTLPAIVINPRSCALRRTSHLNETSQDAADPKLHYVIDKKDRSVAWRGDFIEL